MTNSGSGLAKATIKNMDRKDLPPVTCMFNPKEYKFQKTNSWKEGETPAKDISQLQFTGGKAATLTMQLFFDTYEARTDVREEYTDALWELMKIDQSKKDKKNKFGRPPLVMFQWGRTWAFQAVITSMTQQFTLFLDTGVPVRATVDVTFQQVSDPAHLASQNPTSEAWVASGSGGCRRATPWRGSLTASMATPASGG